MYKFPGFLAHPTFVHAPLAHVPFGHVQVVNVSNGKNSGCTNSGCARSACLRFVGTRFVVQAPFAIPDHVVGTFAPPKPSPAGTELRLHFDFVQCA